MTHAQPVERVAHEIALKWQFRNFGRFNLKGEYVIQSDEIEAFEKLTRETADAVAAAIREAIQEPTEGMVKVGTGIASVESHFVGPSRIRGAWKLMLAASPLEPTK